jgi:hypothetical protein
MGHEVHVTRGGGFGVAGTRPITIEEWREIVTSQTAIVVPSSGSDVAVLGGRPVVFDAGVIATTSPDAAGLAVLRSIATALGARLFGEDGTELGLSAATEVQRVIAVAYPGLDTDVICEELAQVLFDVAEPVLPQAQQRAALKACCGLTGSQAKAALAYLCCRAVESRGQPMPTLTCAAAHLLHCDPALVDGLRGPPTTAWIDELERLAIHVQNRPGHYVIRRCHACGSRNRITLFEPPDRHPRCGRCKALLAALE